jgi:hypothetical protein
VFTGGVGGAGQASKVMKLNVRAPATEHAYTITFGRLKGGWAGQVERASYALSYNN